VIYIVLARIFAELHVAIVRKYSCLVISTHLYVIYPLFTATTDPVYRKSFHIRLKLLPLAHELAS